MSLPFRATDGNAAVHQRRFLASPEYRRGLDARIVSERCASLSDEAQIPLLWFIQQRSWQRGSLRLLAEELVEACHDYICFDRLIAVNMEPVAWLANHLERACIDPRYSLDLPVDRYWTGNFLACLRAYRQQLSASAAGKLCATDVSRLVSEALEYALESPGSMTLCYGQAGIGKTETSRQWCEMRPGVARYIETPAVENERSFYSAIAEELGIPRGTAYNGQQTSLRIIDVLKASRLMLVLDEAHRLWPQKNRPQGSPMRIVWLTTLVNAGVPVGLVAMPEFFTRKALFVKWTNWSDEQFNRRLAMVKALPAVLGEDDLLRVACHVMPAGSLICHKLLASYAQASKHNLTAITETLRSGRFLAKRAGRAEATAADIQAAIREVRAPMDCILAADPETLGQPAILSTAPTRRRGRPGAEHSRGVREASAPVEVEEDEPAANEVFPQQVHPRMVTVSPVAK